MDVLRRGQKPSDLITRESLENAILAVAASGGSTNGVLHLLAVAREMGVPLDIDDFDRIAESTPEPLRPQARRALRRHRPARRGRHRRPGQAPEGTRPAARERADGHRQEHRPARRRGQRSRRPGGHPPARQPDQEDRRDRDPARQPRARGQRGQALRPRAPPAQRPGARLRGRGGDDGRRHVRPDQPRRRRRDPQRGPRRRPRHARDARRHRGDRGGGPRRLRRADHRRPLLRRHARLHGRPRRPRGRPRRPDRRRPARATRSRSTSTTAASTSTSPTRRSHERLADYEPPAPTITRGVLAKYAAQVSQRLRGRDHDAGGSGCRFRR